MKYAIEILETAKYKLLENIRELEFLGHKERCESVLLPEYIERLEEIEKAIDLIKGLEA